MSDSSSSYSCTISIVPLAFIVVWSLGISRYDHHTMSDHAIQYGVGQLVINIVLLFSTIAACGDLMLVIAGIVALLTFIANIVLLGVGFGWFKILTGYTIFEMYNQLGSHYWLSLPLLQGAMYFNLWFSFVVSCVFAAALGVGCSIRLSCTANRKSVSEV
jgi:uncharacterized membrane protein